MPDSIDLYVTRDGEEHYTVSLGENNGVDAWTGADRIAWGGKIWKLVSLQDWAPFRFFRAAAVETEQTDGQG